MGGGGRGGSESIWRRVANRICFPCVSSPSPETILRSSVEMNAEEDTTEKDGGKASNKAVQSLCAICLDPLSSSCGAAACRERRIFTATECGHSFHFACIASNVRHGSVTCPICRAYWSHLPRDLTAFARPHPPADPILRILDDSIATSRVNRRSSLLATRYDDDDPVPPPPPHQHPRLHLSLLPSALSVRLAGQEPTDVVLIVSPNGPHLRLLKQSMALVVFSLRPSDRLAIVVTSSTTASRALPLRRMSPEGKRVALHVIDRTVYLGDGDPAEGLRKGAKILADRAHRNPISRIIHISDSPTRGGGDAEVAGENPVHRFFVGYGFGASNGLVMHEFEEFLVRLMGGEVREVVLRVGGEEVRFGAMRVGEERRVVLDLDGGGGGGGCNYVYMGYSYVEGAGAEERRTTGQVAVVVGEEREGESGDGGEGDKSIGGSGGRRSSSSSNVERWDYLDPFMARRWAKHLHGYKL